MRLDYDREGDRLLYYMRFYNRCYDQSAAANDRPASLFPNEAAPYFEGGKLAGYQFPARLDVLLRLRALLPAAETGRFQAFAEEKLGRVRLEEELHALPDMLIPHLPNFVKTLRPAQVKGIDFCLRHPYTLLACDMGTGKTVMSLYAAQCRLVNKSVRRWLIISPVSGIDDAWFKEMEEASIPFIVATEPEHYAADTPFVIVGREQLLAHLGSRRIRLADLCRAFDGVILDESSVVKNNQSQTHQVVRAMRTAAEAMIFLNGTPVENNLGELWEQVDLLQPDSLGTKAQFLARHEGADRRLMHVELADKVYVAKLETDQPLHIKTIWVSLTEKQAGVYGALDRRLKQTSDPGERFALYTRMQQACDDLALLGETGPGLSAKREFLKEFLPHLACYGRKSILYSQFREWVESLQQEFSGLAYKGGMTRGARSITRRAFQCDPAASFLWVTDAAVKSLNLQCAWHVVSLDLPWSGAVYQLVARARRADTEHPVVWVRVLTDTPLERRKLALIETKRDLLEGSVRSLPEALSDGLVGWNELL